MNINRFFSLGLISLSVLFSGIGCTDQTDKKKPNIIFLLADDLGYSDISYYRNAYAGHSEQLATSETPAIDELAKEGMHFTDFYAGAPVCSPARAALMTGRNATRVGVYNWIPRNSPMHLRSEELTLAELLKEKEYHTGHFGKWHLTSDFNTQPGPLQQGFDYALYTQNNAKPSHHNPVNFIRNGENVGPLEGYASHLVIDEAIEWLQEHKNSDQPFFMNVWFHEPHTPWAAPDSLSSRHAQFPDYYGCIENMDMAIGRLMDFLEKNNLDEETIVIFASDNGSKLPYSNKPLYGWKCFTFEGGVRIPFIIRWPGQVPQGAVSHVPGSFTDIVPSISELTGAELPSDRTIDGVSLGSVFTDEATQVNRKHPIFFYRYFHDPITMLRDGDYVLLGYDSLITKTDHLDHSELGKIEPWGFRENHMNYLDTLKPNHFELYNIRKDRDQENDIAGKYPEKVTKMKNEMLELRNEMIEEGGDWFKNKSVVQR
jgi:arylsulfatase A